MMANPISSLPPFPNDLPTLDLSCISLRKLQAGDEDEAKLLLKSAIDNGFFMLDLNDTLEGKQVLDDIKLAYDLGQRFFGAKDDEKNLYKLGKGNIGYKPLGKIKSADGKPDMTEFCSVARDVIFNKAQQEDLPALFTENKPLLQDAINHMHPIAMLILSRLTQPLGVSPETIPSRHQRDATSETVLRWIHNPPQTDPTSRSVSLIGHTDSGSLTILFPQLGGLQVMPGDADPDVDVEEAWRWVKPKSGCAVINVGDPMVQWSGGILRSGYHRVLYAPGEQNKLDRYSFGYFLKPADDASMSCIREGNMIPFEEVETETGVEERSYHVWHADKSKKIMVGSNSVFRGGRPIKALASELMSAAS